LGPWFLFAPLTGFVVLGAAGIALSADPTFSAYRTVRLLCLLALYLAVLNLPLKPDWVAWPVMGAVAIQAVVALPQFTRGRSLGLARLGEVTVEAAWPGASVVMVGEQRWLRAYGLTQHPNLLGGCLMGMLLLVGGYYLMQPGRRRIVPLLVVGAGLMALLLTFSRAAWLGTVVGGATLAGSLLLARRHAAREAGNPSGERQGPGRSTILLLVGVVAAVLAAFVVLNWPLLRPRLGLASQGVETRSVEARVMQFQAAGALIKEHPVLGVGLGAYPTALYWWARELVADYPVYQPVHNVLLLATAELGLLGGGLWLGLIALPWPMLLARARRRAPAGRADAGGSGSWVTPWMAGLSGALAGLIVVSFLDSYVWSSHQGRLLLWLVLGLWAREWVRST
jgi:O-antigen ligase